MKQRTLNLGYTKEHGNGWYIFCPACNCGHTFWDKIWTFENHDLEFPTFRASMLVNENGSWPAVYDKDTGEEIFPTQHKCHSYVTGGKIQYLNDCSHEYAGQNIDLPYVDEFPTK